MANLNKLLVHVPSSLCDDFRNKYITAETNRDTSYDSKIVFLEKTQEIFAKGKIYSTSVIDFSSLQQLVSSIKELVGSELPEGVTSTNIIDYIGEVKRNLIGEVGDDPSEDTIYGAKSYAQSLDSQLHDSVVSLLIGSIQFDTKASNTICGAKKYANEEAVRVAKKLPTVSEGTGITVTPTTDSNGKINYEISTYPDVFHYKGNVTTTSALPSTGNIGDVWSVGADKSAGSVLYAWDGDEWINIGSPNSVTGVNTKSSHGVSLSRTADGRVQVNVAPGKVAYNDSSVVTGGEVWEKCEPKGTAQDLINNLGYTTVSNSYENASSCSVEGSVTTYRGQVTELYLYPGTGLSNSMYLANKAIQSIEVLGYTLDKNNNSLTVAEARAALEIDGAYTAYSSRNPSSSIPNYFNVDVTTQNGQVKDVVVTHSQEFASKLSSINHIVDTIYNTDSYLNITKSDSGYTTSYELNLNEDAIFNYVADHIWEEYSA